MSCSSEDGEVDNSQSGEKYSWSTSIPTFQDIALGDLNSVLESFLV